MTQDRIEREIAIDAPAERVWELVTQPGWWIGDGSVDDMAGKKLSKDGELDIVEHPRYGTFVLRTEGIEPQRYVAYRCVSGFPRELESGEGTLVEFWLSERGEGGGGTVVRVVESGIAALAVPEETKGEIVEGNTRGWRIQMGTLKTAAERASA